MSELRLSAISVEKEGHRLVRDVSMSLRQGELVVLLGPNGAGKSLTLRASLGLIPLAEGIVTLNGDNIHRIPPVVRALEISYLPQARKMAWPQIVRDIVALGRYAHGAPMGRPSAQGTACIARAIEACDITHLVYRKVTTLSGGELARVHCARALAAQTPLLIADEPINALDPRHQFRVMDLIRNYVEEGGGALVVLHDIAIAARYASRLIFMKSGNIVADGKPTDVLTEDRIKSVYGVSSKIDGLKVEITGVP